MENDALIVLVGFFLFAGLNDFLSVQWNEAREKGNLAWLGAVTALMAGVQWLVIWVAITGENVPIAIADALGSVAGSVFGGWRYWKRKQKDLENADCSGCCLCRFVEAYSKHSVPNTKGPCCPPGYCKEGKADSLDCEIWKA